MSGALHFLSVARIIFTSIRPRSSCIFASEVSALGYGVPGVCPIAIVFVCDSYDLVLPVLPVFLGSHLNGFT